MRTSLRKLLKKLKKKSMTAIKVNEEQAEKVKRDVIILSKSPTNSGSYGTAGFTYSYPTEKVINKSLGQPKLSFSLQSCVSGCGVAIFGTWTTAAQYLQKKPEFRNEFIEIVKSEAIRNGWHCLIATLGDTYISKDSKLPTVYEAFIKEIGFKEVHSYINLVHSPNYNQRIYVCDTKDLK